MLIVRDQKKRLSCSAHASILFKHLHAALLHLSSTPKKNLETELLDLLKSMKAHRATECSILCYLLGLATAFANTMDASEAEAVSEEWSYVYKAGLVLLACTAAAATVYMALPAAAVVAGVSTAAAGTATPAATIAATASLITGASTTATSGAATTALTISTTAASAAAPSALSASSAAVGSSVSTLMPTAHMIGLKVSGLGPVSMSLYSNSFTQSAMVLASLTSIFAIDRMYPSQNKYETASKQ
jgi:hypothetical protein